MYLLMKVSFLAAGLSDSIMVMTRSTLLNLI
jgi:hypothetical protein